MIIDSCFCTVKEDGDKYYILSELYNSWIVRTSLMSVGNTDNDLWDKMVEYCKQNKKETAHFFLDLIDATDKDERIHGNFVGFFNDVISKCFSDDDSFPKFDGYVPGGVMQRLYESYVKWYLDEDANKGEFIKKYK